MELIFLEVSKGAGGTVCVRSVEQEDSTSQTVFDPQGLCGCIGPLRSAEAIPAGSFGFDWITLTPTNGYFLKRNHL